jgi:hypothetical protein
MENPNILGLKTPEQSAAPAGNFLTSQKSVKAWIAGLPVANVGETSRQVFKSLVEFNRLEIPHLDRIKIAEHFNQPVNYISVNLRKYYFDVPFPLSAKNRKIAVLSRELYAELAISYKIFIVALLSGKSDKVDRKLLVIAIHRALKNLGQVLLHSAVIYDPYPGNTWREINQLFAFSEQNNIHEIPVSQFEKGDESSTILDLYRQLSLFSVSSPYRLRQREIERTYNQLKIWNQLSSITKSADDPPKTGVFTIDLGSDYSPGTMESVGKTPAERCRYLDATALIRQLRDALDESQSGSNETGPAATRDSVSPSLLRKLIQVFAASNKREFVRTKLNFELNVAVGLEAIHTLLSAHPEPEKTQVADKDSPDDETDLDWMEQHVGNPGFNAALYTLNNQEFSLSSQEGHILQEETILEGPFTGNGFGRNSQWSPDKDDQVIETFSCKTLNESAGGYCIHWHGENAPNIKVGELVGIQSATNKGQYAIGISRWMKNMPGRGLQLGMEILSPSSTPILAKRAGTNNGMLPQQGLLLPEINASGQPQSLLFSTLPFRVGDDLTINEPMGEFQIRLSRLVESTGAFNQFHFSFLGSRQQDETEDNSDEDKDFDNIWSML